MNVVIITLVFFLLCGIFCVSLLKGSYDYCDTKDLSEEISEKINTMYDCANYGGLWTNPPANFDNVIKAMELMYTLG